MKCCRFSLLLLYVVAGTLPANAHTLGQSYVFLRIYDHSIDVRLEITTDDLRRVLNRAVSLENGAGDEPHERIRRHLDAIRAYVEPRLIIETGGRPLPLRFTSFDVRLIEIADYVLLQFTTDSLARVPESLEVEYTVLFDADPSHRNLLVIEHNWKTATFGNESNVSLIFSPMARRQTLDLSSSSVLRGFAGLVQLGIWHIWIGIDHVLFLLALVLPSVLYRENGRWVPVASFRPALVNVVAVVTCFTIAHTITLSLAALGLIRLPDRLVEAIIAASIAVAALHNLFPRIHIREWSIAFVFGLFHGFGFASVLSHIGLEREYAALSLFGFNLGVEMGQVAIICAAFPLLYLLRNTRVYLHILKYGSILLIGLAAIWFVERLFDVSFFRYTRRALRHVYRRIIGA